MDSPRLRDRCRVLTGLLLVLPILGPAASAVAAAPVAVPSAAGAEPSAPERETPDSGVTGDEDSAAPAGAAPQVASGSVSLAARLREETERARAHLDALERIAREMDEARSDEQASADAALDRAAGLAAALQTIPSGSAEADRLYGSIVEELQRARQHLREALGSLDAPSAIPAFKPALDLAHLRAPGVAEELAGLGRILDSIARREEDLRRREERARREAVEARAPPVERLNAVRIDALQSLSRRGRSRILGFGSEGIAQLKREVAHLTLGARLYVRTRVPDLGRAADVLRDGPVVWRAAFVILKIIVIFVVAFYLRARGAAIEGAVRNALRPSGRSRPPGRRSGALMESLRVLAPWALFLATVWTLKRAIPETGARPEIEMLFLIAVLYGLYRLSIDASFAFIVRTSGRYGLRFDADRTALLVRSVRTILRVVFAIILFLALSVEFLGRGYLYVQALRFAWILLGIAGVVVLSRWRRIIAGAYLALGPDGRLKDAVGAARDRWYGVFVAAASVAWLAGRAGLILARDTALRFDQIRRALAFMTRRRMEKRAEREGYASGDMEALPRHLREAFTEDPPGDDALIVDHFPGLDRLQSALETWHGEGGSGSFLLTGERGMGKTTWLTRVGDGSLPVVRFDLDRRVLAIDDLVRLLGSSLAPDLPAGAGLDHLRAAILEGPARLVVLDRGQHLFLSTIGGYRAYEGFIDLLETTCKRVFWLCAIDAFSWDHLAAVRPDLGLFRWHQPLSGWSEEELRNLIRARLQASGVDLTYENIRSAYLDAVSAEARLQQLEEEYMRLLWDYADGTPRVALHYWLHSLEPEAPGRARVRLFRTPEVEEVERCGEVSLFLLASIITHENLTLEESSVTTRYPETLCRIHTDRLKDMGVLTEDDGRFRVTTHWNRAVIRLLKRKNMISD